MKLSAHITEKIMRVQKFSACSPELDFRGIAKQMTRKDRFLRRGDSRILRTINDGSITATAHGGAGFDRSDTAKVLSATNKFSVEKS